MHVGQAEPMDVVSVQSTPVGWVLDVDRREIDVGLDKADSVLACVPLGVLHRVGQLLGMLCTLHSSVEMNS